MNEDKLFVLMMSKAYELQEYWRNERGPKVGDWTDKGMIVYVGFRPDNIDLSVQSISGGIFYYCQPKALIWHPTIEQLMGMVDMETLGLLATFNDWVFDMHRVYKNTVYISQFETAKQLWLAFVMWELYQKVWRNNQWVKTVA
jgi:hypothetical protein